MNLDLIYTNLIMEHNKNTQNKKNIDANYIERGYNPNCGDDILVQFKIENNKIIDASFNGISCAISTASSSILIDLLKGLDIEKAESLIESFLMMIRGEELSSLELENLEEAGLLKNIQNIPARVKCATLAWNAAKLIVEKAKGEIHS